MYVLIITNVLIITYILWSTAITKEFVFSVGMPVPCKLPNCLIVNQVLCLIIKLSTSWVHAPELTENCLYMYISHTVRRMEIIRWEQYCWR